MVPDIEFPLLDGHLEDEPAVVGAIDTPGATVAPAEYRAVNEVAPLLDALRKQHADRTSDDPEFVYLRNRQQRIEEIRSRETLSLREDTSGAERGRRRLAARDGKRPSRGTRRNASGFGG